VLYANELDDVSKKLGREAETQELKENRIYQCLEPCFPDCPNLLYEKQKEKKYREQAKQRKAMFDALTNGF